MKTSICFTFFLMTLLVSGCIRRSPPLTSEALGNATYSLDSFQGMKVKLTDGRYEGHPGDDENSQITVGMLHKMASGSIAGSAAAAVVLYSNSGGTGTFLDLALVLEKEGTASNIATVNLGDRVRVNDISIDRDTIHVAMTVHGPDDPMCCPTLDVERLFVLRDSSLVEINPSGDADDSN